MEGVGAGLGDDFHLPAIGAARIGAVKHRIDLKLSDGFGGDLQAGSDVRRLVGDARGVNAVEAEVIVVAAAAGETDGFLRAATAVHRAGNQGHEGGPGAAVDGEFGDLILADHAGYLGCAVIECLGVVHDLNCLGIGGDLKLGVDRADLAYRETDGAILVRAESVFLDLNVVDADEQAGNQKRAGFIRGNLTMKTRSLAVNDDDSTRDGSLRGIGYGASDCGSVLLREAGDGQRQS